MNRVKLQCFGKLRKALEHLAERHSLSQLSKTIKGALSSELHDPAVLLPQGIKFQINRDLLYFNSEISEFVADIEKSITLSINQHLETNNSQR